LNEQQKYLVVIAGPTAVGKTALAIELARHFNSKIISADSRQFYKEMSIGTAKPSAEEMAMAEHFFINTKSIHDTYNIGEYEKEAVALLDELFREHRVLFLVGGSGLYINAVLYGMDEFEEVKPEVREEIVRNYKEKGIAWLQSELEEKDPDYFAEVDTNNPQRMMRGLEVCVQTGKPYSAFLSRSKKSRNFEPVKILINTERDVLYEKINRRVDKMMKDGLLEEAQKLYPYKDLNALNTVGYKEIFGYLDGKMGLEEAVNLIKQKTRNYAKRQLTWFNNQDNYETFEPGDTEKIKAYLEIILQH